jgi:hypothetical protein
LPSSSEYDYILILFSKQFSEDQETCEVFLTCIENKFPFLVYVTRALPAPDTIKIAPNFDQTAVNAYAEEFKGEAFIEELVPIEVVSAEVFTKAIVQVLKEAKPSIDAKLLEERFSDRNVQRRLVIGRPLQPKSFAHNGLILIGKLKINPNSLEILPNVCNSCAKKFDRVLNLCAKCQVVKYCSRDCQRKDWVARHRSECRADLSPTQGISWFSSNSDKAGGSRG